MLLDAPPSRFMRRFAWLGAVGVALAYLLVVHASALHRPIGLLGDDAVYALGARALATGQGYVDLATAGHPVVNRFPPGFSAVLAVALAGTHSVTAEAERLRWVPGLMGGLWLLCAFAYFRRRAGMHPLAALLATTLVAVQPYGLMVGTMVLSETTFALVLLWALWALEVALGTGTSALPLWLGVGMLSGAACLVRTAGIGLVLGAVAALLLARRYRALAGYLSAFVLAWLPWSAYQASAGRNDYLAGFWGRLPGTPAALGLVALTSLLAFFGTALPGVFMPSLFMQLSKAPSPWQLALGALASGVVLSGMARRLGRPWAPERAVGPLLVLASSLLLLGYGLAFAYYAWDFFPRALLPLTPFLLVYAYEGAQHLLRDQPPRTRQAVLCALALGSLLSASSLTYDWIARDVYFNDYYPDTERAFAFVREELPPDAVLYCSYSDMASFYTGHRACGMRAYPQAAGWGPRYESGDALVRYLFERQVSYIVGIPVWLPGDPNDEMVVQLNGLAKSAPGLLRVVYRNRARNVQVFALDRMTLGMLARKAMQQEGR